LAISILQEVAMSPEDEVKTIMRMKLGKR